MKESKHKCPRCRTIWEHGEDCCGSHAAHLCSVSGCGGVQYEKVSAQSDEVTYTQLCGSSGNDR